MQYSAWSGSWKKPCEAMPTWFSSQLARPKVGSSSQLKMIAVATVETATGMNTAVR